MEPAPSVVQFYAPIDFVGRHGKYTLEVQSKARHSFTKEILFRRYLFKHLVPLVGMVHYAPPNVRSDLLFSTHLCRR